MHSSLRLTAHFTRALLALALIVVGIGVVEAGPRRAGAAALQNNGSEGRNAWNAGETTLTPASITSGSFGQTFATHLEGAVMGQPVVARGTVVVGTEEDRVYGLDPSSGQVLWSRTVGTPIEEAAQQGCPDLPVAGITSSPVVEPSTGAVYLMAKTYLGTGDQIVFQLHKVDPTTGAEYGGFPTTIGGVADNDASSTFDGTYATQRAGLLLDQGVVYAAFGSVCDLGDFKGWIVGVNGTTAALTARFVTEVGAGEGAGIWQSGSGIASDGPGRLLFSTGNGTTPEAGTLGSQPPGTLGQSVVRLAVQPNGSLKPVDFFTPIDGPALNEVDGDLGSGGPVLLPSSFQTSTASRIVALGSKGGYVYLMDAGSLGGMGAGPKGSDSNLQTLGPLGAVYGDPVAWPGGGGYLYVASSLPGLDQGGGNPSLAAYRWGTSAAGGVSMTLAGTAYEQPGFGTSSPVLSSNGSKRRSGILWQTWQPIAGGNEELRAYNPIPVDGKLQEIWSAPVGKLAKFLSPVVDDGHVYVGSGDGTVFGFGMAAPAPLVASSLAVAPSTVNVKQSSTITLRATTAVTVTSASVAPGRFSVKPISSPISLVAGSVLNLRVRFSPTTIGSTSTALTVGLRDRPSQTFTLNSYGIYPGPHLTLSSKVLIFGTGGLGGGVVRASVTVTNVGSTPATLAGVTAQTPPFSVKGEYTGAVVQPGASVVISFSLATGAVGRFTSKATISTSTQAITVSLVGNVGQPAIVTVSPAMLRFGNVVVGQSATRTVTLTNTGATPASWSPSLHAYYSTQEWFSIVGTGPPRSIPAHSSVSFEISYTPLDYEHNMGLVEVQADDGFVPRQVWLDGAGIPSGHPVINAESINVRPGSTTAWVPVDVSPAPPAGASFTVSTVDGTATSASGAYQAVVSRSLTFRQSARRVFVPISVNPDTGAGKSFSLEITSATGAAIGQSATVSFRQSAAEVVSYVTADPADFVVNQVEDQVIQVPVRVSPILSAPVTCSATTVDGTAAASNGDFVALTGSPVVIPPNGRGSIPVVVKASPALNGARSFSVVLSGCTGEGTLELERPSATVTLLGVLGQRPAVEIEVQKKVITAPAVGLPTIGTVTLRAVGGAPLTIYQVAPVTDPRFELLTPMSSGLVLQPGSTFTLQFRYTPTGNTMVRANFQLNTSTDPAAFNLNLIGQTGGG